MTQVTSSGLELPPLVDLDRRTPGENNESYRYQSSGRPGAITAKPRAAAA